MQVPTLWLKSSPTLQSKLNSLLEKTCFSRSVEDKGSIRLSAFESYAIIERGCHESCSQRHDGCSDSYRQHRQRENSTEERVKLLSPDFSDGGNIPERFTCEGMDVSPTLRIDGVPKAAKSLVLVVDDPDARGGNFTHWLMRNIAPNLTEIVGNKPPRQAVQGVNDFGKTNTLAHVRHQSCHSSKNIF